MSSMVLSASVAILFFFPLFSCRSAFSPFVLLSPMSSLRSHFNVHAFFFLFSFFFFAFRSWVKGVLFCGLHFSFFLVAIKPLLSYTHMQKSKDYYVIRSRRYWRSAVRQSFSWWRFFFSLPSFCTAWWNEEGAVRAASAKCKALALKLKMVGRGEGSMQGRRK